MTPTRPSTLVALFVSAAAIAWGLLRVLESRGTVLPPLPWLGPFSIGVLGAAVVVSAASLHRRLLGRPGTKPPNPIGVARLAALAKAASHAGALIGGAYAGWVLLLLPDLEVTGRRDRAAVAVVAVVASLVLIAGGLVLERVCRVRPPRDEDTQAAA